MGGYFATALKEDCTFDLFFGTDYHSHLGTRRAGMVVFGKDGFNRAIHNIENNPFRSKFESDLHEMQGTLGIGCISDFEPQPLITRSHHGTYAISTIGRINNREALIERLLKKNNSHFMELSGGEINATELVSTLINEKDNLIEGLLNAQDLIDGSMSILLLTPQGVYLSRDKFGRTPIVIGKKSDGYCASFESFAFLNLGYEAVKELGPGEIVVMTPEGIQTLADPQKEMRICTFLWAYYGYPTSSYEGVSVETMRQRSGALMATRDGFTRENADSVAGVPDSGLGAAIGYSNASEIPFSRPFIKYTPTWPRSFMPAIQERRNLIAKMKLIPVHDYIDGQRLVLIDDSIVRGTQLRETSDFLFDHGAKEVHVRPACPPLLFACKYLNFSRSTSEMELIARRIIAKEEGEEIERSILDDYADPQSERYARLQELTCKEMGFTSLKYMRLDDLIAATGLPKECLCTYCWDGRA